jgi:hypothetical protein
VSDVFRHQSRTGKSYCRTRFDVGSKTVKRYYKLRYQLFMSLSTMVYHTFYKFYIIVLKLDKLDKNKLHNKLCNMHWLCMMVAYSLIISVNTMRYQLFMSLGTIVYHTFYEFYITVLKMDKLGKNTLHNKLCNMHWLCMMVAYSLIISVNTMRYQLFMSLGTMVYHTFYEFYTIVLKMAKLGKTRCIINYVICISCAWWWPTPSIFQST